MLRCVNYWHVQLGCVRCEQNCEPAFYSCVLMTCVSTSCGVNVILWFVLTVTLLQRMGHINPRTNYLRHNCASCDVADGKSLMLTFSSAAGNEKKTCGAVCVIHCQQNKTDCKIWQLCESSFKNLKEAGEVRKVQGNENKQMQDIWCYIPAEYVEYRICMGIVHDITITLMNFSRILKQKNPSERDDVSSSHKVKTANLSSARVLLPANRCLFLWIESNYEGTTWL